MNLTIDEIQECGVCFTDFNIQNGDVLVRFGSFIEPICNECKYNPLTNCKNCDAQMREQELQTAHKCEE